MMPEPIRVLQVFAQMNRGGAETMIMHLYRHIDRNKIQFDFIVHTEEKCAFDDEIEQLGGRIYRIPRYSGKNHFIYKRAWRDFFIKYPEYKIIHGHVRSTASIYLGIAKRYGLITIAHSHNTSSGKGFSAIAKNILQHSIRYTADYLFACSRLAGEWLFGEKACMSEKFFILNNAIEAKKFIFNVNIRAKKRKEFQIEDKFVIGHIGRFHTQKNHKFLIDIFEKVHDRNKNAVLLLIGDGELRNLIAKKVDALGLTGSVIFTGIRSDIPELLQAMDIFVFPSLYEGLPVTLVEAQAAGLKIIAADTITEEIKLTNLVDFVQLTDSTSYWAEKVLQYTYGYERTNAYSEICKAGYDVKENAKWLEEFYLNEYKSK
jgi:glycosyltransferase involved in cell wall biosynthesis